jgi:hypothetical protein
VWRDIHVRSEVGCGGGRRCFRFAIFSVLFEDTLHCSVYISLVMDE